MQRLLAIYIATSLAGLCYSQELPRGGRVRDTSFRMSKPVLSWKELRENNVVMQQRDYSCGAAALATLLRYHWRHDVSEADVLSVVETMLSEEQLADREADGLTIADVEDAAKKMGYNATVGELTYAKLTKSKVPLILVVKLEGINHFVVYRDDHLGVVYLADPFRGNTRMTAQCFQTAWQRNAVLVVAPPGQTSSPNSKLGLTAEDIHKGYLNRHIIRTAASPRPSIVP